jgi:hypothetical protein
LRRRDARLIAAAHLVYRTSTGSQFMSEDENEPTDSHLLWLNRGAVYGSFTMNTPFEIAMGGRAMDKPDSDSVPDSWCPTSGNIVSFGDARGRLRCGQALRTEALALIQAHGYNAYSDFILKHGKRPDRCQAAAIGRLLGIRVRAADGTLQPQRIKQPRGAALRQQTKDDFVEQVLRLRRALAYLSENRGDPADVIAYVDPLFDDVSVIRSQLPHAVYWINRFAEEWSREPKASGGPGQIQQDTE